MERPDFHLSKMLAEIAATMLTERNLKDDLLRVVRMASSVVPNCTAGSIALLVDGNATSAAVTDHVALEVDVVQYENDEGPCLQALGGHVVRIGFVPEDQRFPHFAVGAADTRVLSVLSTPMIDHGTVVGTLNLYSHQAEAFDEQSADLARIFATEAATAVVSSALYEQAVAVRQQIQEAHDEQAVVSLAQGYLMGLNEITEAQALALLHYASDTNAERLVDAAHRVLDAAKDEHDDHRPPEDDTSTSGDDSVRRPSGGGGDGGAPVP